MDSLNTLPHEMIVKIFESCPTEDLQQIQLVNKELNRVATEVLIKRITKISHQIDSLPDSEIQKKFKLGNELTSLMSFKVNTFCSENKKLNEKDPRAGFDLQEMMGLQMELNKNMAIIDKTNSLIAQHTKD